MAYYNVNDPEEFWKFILSKADGRSLDELSKDLGYSRDYFRKVKSKGRIAPPALHSIAKEINIQPEELKERARAQKPKSESREKKDIDDFWCVALMEQLRTMHETQRALLAAIQRLNGMFERTWCK